MKKIILLSLALALVSNGAFASIHHKKHKRIYVDDTRQIHQQVPVVHTVVNGSFGLAASAIDFGRRIALSPLELVGYQNH